MSSSTLTRKEFVRGFAGGAALAFAGGAGLALADADPGAPAVAAIFLGADMQPYQDDDDDDDMDHLDTVWVYFDDMTFTQYAFLDDGIVKFSEGTYEFENGADFKFEPSEDVHNITITRTAMYAYDTGLAPYDSTDTYDLGAIGFVKIFPLDEAPVEGGFVGMPNPWSDVASAEEAAAGAGLDELIVPDPLMLDGVESTSVKYRCMEGLAEVIYEWAAAQFTFRKGVHVEGDDVSGDYNTYAYEWTTDVDGIEVFCAGNREGDATKVTWCEGDYDFAILSLGLGGDTDFGLNEERLVEFMSQVG